jgi:hypothetical protein
MPMMMTPVDTGDGPGGSSYGSAPANGTSNNRTP